MLLRPLAPRTALRACTRIPTKPIQPPSATTIRTFLPGLPLSSTPSSPPTPQTVTATRHLPYPPGALYRIISDIDSYASFIPYVLASTVVERHPTTNAPTAADLRIGFTPIDETFRSKVTCVEPSLVEADASGVGAFRTLKTRWEIRGAGKGEGGQAGEGSVVDLKIDMSFSNPIYTILTQAAVPKVAGVIIEAFEKRAQKLLEGKEGEGAKKA